MKCEICHKADAAVAIRRGEGDGAEELYVCGSCAAAEKLRRKKKSMRTRREGESAGVSITVSGGEAPPPFIAALMDAVHDMVGDLGKSAAERPREEPKGRPRMRDFPCRNVEGAYRFCGRLHLEGLHLIGELEAVRRAANALKIELAPVDADGVKSAGHVYQPRSAGGHERVRRFVGDLLREERNARVRLASEMPRVFADSICRALAVLKNCRLLSPGELFDLLSPLRLGAMDGMLDGIDAAAIEGLAEQIDLTSSEDGLEQKDRDALDAERADEMNRRFEDVVLSDRAEEEL